MQNEPILIWGAGAIGGTIGAILSHAGYDVTFVDIDKNHVEAIASPEKGLTITGPVAQLTVTAPAFLPQDLQGKWKRIFLAVKSQHTRQACESLLPHLADDGYVLSLQNGLCETIIADCVGKERTVGAFVNFGADWIGAGEVHFGNRAAVVVGEIDGSITPRLENLLADLQIFEPDAIISDDIASYLWGKLAYGSLLFAQAVGNMGIADCLARPELLPLWRALAGEIVDTARAIGVKPKGFNGFDPDAFGKNASPEAAAQSVEAMVAFNRPNAKTHSGVWRDIAIRKRPTEVDTQLGSVLEVAQQHGIGCTALGQLVDMIHLIEQGKKSQSDANLTEIIL